jgi:hypothetical protein
MDTENKIVHALDGLVNDLGKEDAIAYIRFALPILAERRDVLLLLLAGENWVEAAALAHKTLSSVHAYDDGSLEVLLKHIEEQATTEINQPLFRQRLQEVFDSLLVVINDWERRQG